MNARRFTSAGVAVAAVLLVTSAAPAAAESGWRTEGEVQEIEIESGDSTSCEFEPGVITEYEVDDSTLPQYDRLRLSIKELPSGEALYDLTFVRSGVRFLKLDPAAPGPDVLIEDQEARVWGQGTFSEPITTNSIIVLTERTPDGDVVDVSRSTRGTTTGLCRA